MNYNSINFFIYDKIYERIKIYFGYENRRGSQMLW